MAGAARLVVTAWHYRRTGLYRGPAAGPRRGPGPAASRHTGRGDFIVRKQPSGAIAVSGAPPASRLRYHCVIGGHGGRQSWPVPITAAPARAPGTQLPTRPPARTAYHQPTWVYDGAARMAGHEPAG